ncbi:hypothetical protein [Zhongshania sp.]|uniref:hypothetical protein n=1 Tax=Zhongshania sp. TaxID=1971902 RepID=UPI0035643304
MSDIEQQLKWLDDIRDSDEYKEAALENRVELLEEQITRLRAELAEAEGQDVLYVVLDTNTGRPESEFVEIENAEGFSVEVFSVIDSGGFRRIGPLYTHPAPAKVPEVNFDDVPVSVKELTPEAAWICGYYACREAGLEAQGGE